MLSGRGSNTSRITSYNVCYTKLLRVAQEGLQLGPVGHQVAGEVEAAAQRMGLVDADGQVLLEKVVVAHPQAVAGQSRVDGVGAVGEGVAGILEGARGGEQLRSVSYNFV